MYNKQLLVVVMTLFSLITASAASSYVVEGERDTARILKNSKKKGVNKSKKGKSMKKSKKGGVGAIPNGNYCRENSDCAVPLGLSQGVCICKPNFYEDMACTCQSGQPDAYCDEPSDCLIPLGLDHSVCRDDPKGRRYHLPQCQSGQPGALCGETSDCVTPPDLEHPVCREGKCQQGKRGNYCGNDSDCIKSCRKPIGKCR